MYARINLTVEEHKNVLVVPKTAVVDYSQRPRRMGAERQRTSRRYVPLKLGIENAEQFEVLEGIKEGARFDHDGCRGRAQQRSARLRRPGPAAAVVAAAVRARAAAMGAQVPGTRPRGGAPRLTGSLNGRHSDDFRC